jgi:hypothetical protein
MPVIGPSWAGGATELEDYTRPRRAVAVPHRTTARDRISRTGSSAPSTRPPTGRRPPVGRCRPTRRSPSCSSRRATICGSRSPVGCGSSASPSSSRPSGPAPSSRGRSLSPAPAPASSRVLIGPDTNRRHGLRQLAAVCPDPPLHLAAAPAGLLGGRQDDLRREPVRESIHPSSWPRSSRARRRGPRGSASGLSGRFRLIDHSRRFRRTGHPDVARRDPLAQRLGTAVPRAAGPPRVH